MFEFVLLTSTFAAAIQIRRAILLGMPIFARLIFLLQVLFLFFTLHAQTDPIMLTPAIAFAVLAALVSLLMTLSVRGWVRRGGDARALIRKNLRSK